LTVLGVGGGIAAVATIVLVLIFRRFGGKSHVALLGVLIGFIFLCCVALFLASHE
jgi:hypothetical protein